MNGGFSNVASVTAALTAGGAVAVSDQASDTCEPIQLNPTMSVDKACAPELVADSGQVVVKINVTGNICNTSSVLTLGSLSATDNPAAAITLAKTTLAPNECTTYTGSYLPSTAGSANPSQASFSDTVTVTGTSSHGGGKVQGVASATCPLCPPCTGPGCTQ